MKYKVKVKKMSIAKNKANKLSYQIVFDICDKISVAGQQFGLGVNVGTNKKRPINIARNTDLVVPNIGATIYNFISLHAKETLIVEIDKNNTITRVELIYG